jgi:DNA polymerase-1
MDSLEADDAMGIYATKNPGNCIVSPDKDMKQIPGKLFNLDESFTITKEQGARWHLEQTLAGDSTDGYSGVPSIGIKRAQTLFDQKGYSWKTVVDAFKEKDLDEEVALTNARLARILTAEDYDFEQKQPILWSPSADYRIDDGARLKA